MPTAHEPEPRPATSSPGLSRRAPRLFPTFFAAAVLVAAACGQDPTSGATCETDPSLCEEPGPDTTAAYLSNLPSWQAFAQPDTTLRNELNAEGDTLPIREEIIDSVLAFDADGVSDVMRDVRYVCQARPYSISDAPEKITMFDPNRSILYAGAMIQGRSKKELGSLLPLAIAERRPVVVSIPDLPTGENSREVVPTQGSVESARGEMIGDAVANDLLTPTTTSFEMETYHSERSFALSANLSGSYLGFEASASGSLARSVAETTVTANFYQKMYTVVVEAPVEGFFGDDFDNDALAGYITDGLIGPDNLPVYVSEIVYGRMMMFSVTSTASESDIRSAMQASYDSFTGSASGGLNTRQQAVLENSKIAITAVGGSGDAVAAMIRSGDWSVYFDAAQSAELSQAVPLTYTFTNVGDGSIAAVTEATEYSINECQPKPLVPGTFDFSPRQDIPVPLTPGYETHFGDVDGDGTEDMIFSYRSGSTNEIAVAFADATGNFSVSAAQDATVAPAEGWSLYDHVAVGDFDDDGDADIVFNKLEAENAFYVALSNGDGTFTWGDRQQRPEPGWTIYQVRSADVDNADGDDLVWNGINSGHNRTYVALSAADGTFDLTQGAMDKAGTCCWAGTDFLLGDVTGDGFVDMIHSRTLSDGNANWVSAGAGDGTFAMADIPGFTYSATNGWTGYEPHVGDIDGDQRADMIWIAHARADIPIHRGIGKADGTFTLVGWQHVPEDADGAGPYEVRLGDVDADGDTDIVMVDLDSSNNNPALTNRARIWVGLGTDDQIGKRFDFTPVDQLHPEQVAWGQFRVHMTDVDGDGKSDLLLHWATSPHQVFVALAK